MGSVILDLMLLTASRGIRGLPGGLQWFEPKGAGFLVFHILLWVFLRYPPPGHSTFPQTSSRFFAFTLGLGDPFAHLVLGEWPLTWPMTKLVTDVLWVNYVFPGPDTIGSHYYHPSPHFSRTFPEEKGISEVAFAPPFGHIRQRLLLLFSH